MKIWSHDFRTRSGTISNKVEQYKKTVFKDRSFNCIVKKAGMTEWPSILQYGDTHYITVPNL